MTDRATLRALVASIDIARQRLRDGELDSADAHLGEVRGQILVLLANNQEPARVLPDRTILNRRQEEE